MNVRISLSFSYFEANGFGNYIRKCVNSFTQLQWKQYSGCISACDSEIDMLNLMQKWSIVIGSMKLEVTSSWVPDQWKDFWWVKLYTISLKSSPVRMKSGISYLGSPLPVALPLARQAWWCTMKSFLRRLSVRRK